MILLFPIPIWLIVLIIFLGVIVPKKYKDPNYRPTQKVKKVRKEINPNVAVIVAVGITLLIVVCVNIEEKILPTYTPKKTEQVVFNHSAFDFHPQREK